VSYSLKSTLSFSYYSRQINIRSFLVNEVERADSRNECAMTIAAVIKLRFYVRILPYLRHSIQEYAINLQTFVYSILQYKYHKYYSGLQFREVYPRF